MSSRQTAGIDHLDTALEELGAPCDIPGLCDELESQLSDLQPVRTRSRRAAFVSLGAASAVYSLALLWFLDLRTDLDTLSRPWLILNSVAWLASFLAIAYLALVPRRGQVSPSWRHAGVAALVASVGFVLSGLMLGRPALDHTHSDLDVGSALTQGYGCLSIGTISALLPILLGALLLRGRLPVGAHWAGAGLGAAGGSLGGLLLHLHCSIVDPLHLGLMHGGVVVLGALLGALLLPRTANAT